jgi:4-hydroxy-3-methylbut-2-enyl diphosphate reductase
LFYCKKEKIDALIVIGSQNSSNSNRLRDLGEEMGVLSYLIENPEDFNLYWFKSAKNIGITAGASAPEILVNNIINYIKKLYNKAEEKSLDGIIENLKFKLPSEVR